MIRLEDIHFSSEDGVQILKSISCTVKENQRTAIIGRNGSGKSTFAKIICGLLKPSFGKVWIDGVDTINYTPAHCARLVGYVFQNPDDQIFHSTVRDEIMYAPKILKFSSAQTKIAFERAVELTNLGAYLDENPYDLNLSMRKFVSIASILAMDSKIIIFDEPDAGQDYQGLSLLGSLLAEIQREGKTVLAITHNMDFAAYNFDDLIVMEQGSMIKHNRLRNVFTDHEFVQKNNLMLPVICHLSAELQIKHDILTIQELVFYLKDNL